MCYANYAVYTFPIQEAIVALMSLLSAAFSYVRVVYIVSYVPCVLHGDRLLLLV